MKKYIQLLRLEQWVKNVFIFLPLFFSGLFLKTDLLLKSIFAFFIFSLVASSIYIINDYIDIESDKKHPIKRRRPLAAGAISKIDAKKIFVFLIVLSIILILLGHHFLGSFQGFGIIIGAYFIMNIFYTLKWKHIPIVDIFIIAMGFVLRVLAGGSITGISISQWAILLTFVLSLVLAIGKRRGELINAEISGKTRKSLDGYNVQFADIILSISCTLSIICYLMFTLSPDVQERFSKNIFYTAFFVIFAFFRYLQQTLVYNRTESPTRLIYKDKYIQVTVILWFISFISIIYLNKS